MPLRLSQPQVNHLRPSINISGPAMGKDEHPMNVGSDIRKGRLDNKLREEEIRGRGLENQLREKKLGDYDQDKEAERLETRIATQSNAVKGYLDAIKTGVSEQSAQEIYKGLGGEDSVNIDYMGEDVSLSILGDDGQGWEVKGKQDSLDKVSNWLEAVTQNPEAGLSPEAAKSLAENGISIKRIIPKKEKEKGRERDRFAEMDYKRLSDELDEINKMRRSGTIEDEMGQVVPLSSAQKVEMFNRKRDIEKRMKEIRGEGKKAQKSNQNFLSQPSQPGSKNALTEGKDVSGTRKPQKIDEKKILNRIIDRHASMYKEGKDPMDDDKLMTATDAFFKQYPGLEKDFTSKMNEMKIKDPNVKTGEPEIAKPEESENMTVEELLSSIKKDIGEGPDYNEMRSAVQKGLGLSDKEMKTVKIDAETLKDLWEKAKKEGKSVAKLYGDIYMAFIGQPFVDTAKGAWNAIKDIKTPIKKSKGK